MEQGSGPSQRALIVLLVCTAVTGVAAAMLVTPRARTWIDSAMALAMIVAGVLILSPLSMTRAVTPEQRLWRRRGACVGAALAINGLSHLVPDGVLRVGLMVTGLVIITAALFGRPKRLFRPNV